MKMTIHSNSSLEVTKGMRNYIEEAVIQLGDIIPDDSTVSCVCKHSKRENGFEIMIKNKEYGIIRAETYTDDFYDSVDKSIDKITSSARKYHKKMIDAKKRNKKYSEVYSEIKKDYENDEYKKSIIRKKEVSAVAMSIESAMLQLETLDYDFFLFLDSKSLVPCVIYKRNEDGFGLIKLV